MYIEILCSSNNKKKMKKMKTTYYDLHASAFDRCHSISFGMTVSIKLAISFLLQRIHSLYMDITRRCS